MFNGRKLIQETQVGSGKHMEIHDADAGSPRSEWECHKSFWVVAAGSYNPDVSEILPCFRTLTSPSWISMSYHIMAYPT
jgi:hypothetical protein